MKKLACIVLELEGNESPEDVIRQLEKLKAPREEQSYFFKANPGQPWEERYKFILNKFGVTRACKGYMQLYYVIEGIALNPELLNNFTLKQVYAHAIIASHSDYSCVERNIRSLKERIYSLNNVEEVNKIINNSNLLDAYPSNGNFIALMAEAVLK